MTSNKFELKQSNPETITTNLDPKLQEVILKERDKIAQDKAVCSQTLEGDNLVDVIARLKNPLEITEGLKVVCKAGDIVTGQVEVSEIESVRSNPNILALKLAAKLRPQLQFSVDEINATPAQMATGLPNTLPSINGTGIIIGILDYGCDIRHNDFRNEDGTTRLLSLWDQTGGESPLAPSPYNYGREFDSAKINEALGTSNPYTHITYDPGNEAHGTHVMGIAAGNGRSTGFPGVAPKADLIFVNLAHDDIDLIEETNPQPLPSGESPISSFGNSKMLMEAVDYVFKKAEALGRPAVVNLSVGTHGGPHDGSTLAEKWFDTFLDTPNRAIVIAAGNSYEAGSHARGEITNLSPRSLSWQIPSTDNTNNELEVWYDGSKELFVALETPSGQRLNPVELGTTVTLTNTDDVVVGRIIHRKNDSGNNDNHIDIILGASLQSGAWKVHLTNRSTEAVDFHAWVERDDFNRFVRTQSRLATVDNDSSFTIGSIACGEKTIAVGSYLSGLPEHNLSPFSSAGPTRNNRQKPEVSAPGQFLNPFWEQGILAASSRTQGATRMSGTSMACPHVTGMIALILQAANRNLSIDEIRETIIRAARRNNPSLSGWDSRYGFGRVDTIASILEVLPDSFPSSLPATGDSFVTKHSHSDSTNALEEIVSIVTSVAKQSQSKVKLQIEVE